MKPGARIAKATVRNSLWALLAVIVAFGCSISAVAQTPDPNTFLPDPISEDPAPVSQQGPPDQSQGAPDSTVGAGDEPPGSYLNSRPAERLRKNKPLQGGIEQSELKGSADDTVLEGGAGDADWQMDAQKGSRDRSSRRLQGGAGDTTLSGGTSEDPDAGNQELDIEWDRWRNTLIQAIQANTVKNINVHNNINFVWDPRTQMMQSRYPNGTSVWYFLNVLPNRKIVNVRLTQMSQYPSYDQAVLQAINSLQGNKILQYPRGSKRTIVAQEANVSTSAESSIQNFNFGDVERQQY
jgi:hypothetical protein